MAFVLWTRVLVRIRGRWDDVRCQYSYEYGSVHFTDTVLVRVPTSATEYEYSYEYDPEVPAVQYCTSTGTVVR